MSYKIIKSRELAPRLPKTCNNIGERKKIPNTNSLPHIERTQLGHIQGSKE